MKFNALASVLILSASTVLAGTFHAPVSGQKLSVGEPFSFNYTSDKYFKQATHSISVLLSPDKFASDTIRHGLVLKADVEPTGYLNGMSNYYVEGLTPIVTPGGLRTGLCQVVVIEKYRAWGGADAISFDTVDAVMEEGFQTEGHGLGV